jgi:hypothetical protein
MRMQVYLRKLFKVVSERRLWLTVLGKTGRQYIWIVRSTLEFDHDRPNFLIAAGFHGEEIAGPFAILKWLETATPNQLAKANFTFLPVMNPIGFNRGSRYARAGEKTNAGFYHVEESKDVLSTEGQILMENVDFLIKAARDGFLSLHEDETVDKFYVYDYVAEERAKPSSFARAMRDEEKKFFDVIADNTPVNEEGDPNAVVWDGIVYHLCDGSFEDMLMHNGIPRAITTETPSLGIGLEKRVEAGVALITKFVNLSVRRSRVMSKYRRDKE